MSLVETAAVPSLLPDPIDDLICTIREYSAPIEFAQAKEEALQLIGNNLALEKKIILFAEI